MPKKDLDSGDELLAASFGKCLARHREAADMSLAALGNAAGMGRAYVWRLEQGQILPSLRNIARLSVALEVPVARLVEGLDTSSIRLENRAYEKEE
ncbi:helix-turn-helix domain-containing protein [Qipengyuania sp. GH25]|uniref:Helix-turn-helix domain-containing protein n=1 Tax=Qipengyuania pacifica TaxID=2860199 RepID=A0ABS7JK42_9SPHN|nr:helix-turn-helix transcriptional regulator [Qipengyuania aerophila]MBX7489756.1 helix-turn-helix domain-containing protein [Qipengyuania aerophila]